MKKTWVKNTIVMLVAFAMVFGLCFVLTEQAANADATVTITNNATRNLAFGEATTVAGTFTVPEGETFKDLKIQVSTGSTVTLNTPTYDTTAGTFSVTATAGTTAGDNTVTVTVTTNNGTADVDATADISLNVKALAVTGNGSSSTSRLSIEVGSSAAPTFSYGPTSAYSLSSGDTTKATITDDNKIKGVAAGDVEVTLTCGAQTATIYVTVTRKTPSLSVKTPSGTSATDPYKLNNGSSFTAEIETTSDGTISWSSDATGVASVSNVNAKTSTVSSVNTSGTVAAITVTTAQTSTYSQASVTFYVKVVAVANVFVEKTSVTIPVGSSTTIQVNTNGGGYMTASSNKTNIATVSYPTNSEAGQLTINGIAAGTAVVTVGGAGTGSTKVINVTVGNPTPTITLTFRPDVTKLGYGEYTYMDIHVDNPKVYDDGYYYAKITRANRRIYLEDNTYYSHPSTMVYWVRLDSNGDATVLIRPQYSGSVKVSVDSASASTASRTFTVSGYPTLPQTGQDFTLIYVLGACCLVAAGTWVAVYAKKKKNSTVA